MPIEHFLEKCRKVTRLKHLSYRTEETYLLTIRRFIEFHGGRTHPKEMGAEEIRAYLSHLAIEGKVAASTRNVAFSALLFLYRDVLHLELPAIEHVERAQRPSRLPELFTGEEARAVLSHLEGTPRLMASLLYGGGLRSGTREAGGECVRLRVKDVDFPRRQITVRDGRDEGSKLEDRASLGCVSAGGDWQIGGLRGWAAPRRHDPFCGSSRPPSSLLC